MENLQDRQAAVMTKCRVYLKSYKWFFKKNVINLSYYTNMKWYITCLSYFAPNPNLIDKLEKELADVKYTLNCIKRGYEGEQETGIPSRIIGILNRSALTGNYKNFTRFAEGHYEEEIEAAEDNVTD